MTVASGEKPSRCVPRYWRNPVNKAERVKPLAMTTSVVRCSMRAVSVMSSTRHNMQRQHQRDGQQTHGSVDDFSTKTYNPLQHRANQRPLFAGQTPHVLTRRQPKAATSALWVTGFIKQYRRFHGATISKIIPTGRKAEKPLQPANLDAGDLADENPHLTRLAPRQ